MWRVKYQRERVINCRDGSEEAMCSSFCLCGLLFSGLTWHQYTMLKTRSQRMLGRVMKEQNPPNLPMLRPIETFWSHLKAKVYYNGWEAKSIEEMKKRISYCLTKFRTPYFRNLFKDTKKWIVRAEKKGVVILREK